MNEEKLPQQPIIFEDVEEPEKPIIKTEKKEVTPFDKFKLAKGILLFSFVLFAIIAVTHGIIGSEYTKEIWDYSKVIINDIVFVVIGFYFGSKDKSE